MKLPKTLLVGSGKALSDEFRDKFSLATEVEQCLVEEYGYVVCPMPKQACPRLTAEVLLTLNSDEYATSIAMHYQWWEYYSQQLVFRQTRVREKTNEIKTYEAHLRKSIQEQADIAGEKLTIEKTHDHLLRNPYYEEKKIALQKVEHESAYLAMEVDRLDRALAILSRNIVLMQHNYELERVGSSFQQRDRRRE